jgi:hypothetical protein
VLLIRQMLSHVWLQVISGRGDGIEIVGLIPTRLFCRF